MVRIREIVRGAIGNWQLTLPLPLALSASCRHCHSVTATSNCQYQAAASLDTAKLAAVWHARVH